MKGGKHVQATTTFKEEIEYDDEVEMTEYSKGEEEYLDFLEQFGHIDFTYVEWLPTLATVKQLKEIRRKEWLAGS